MKFISTLVVFLLLTNFSYGENHYPLSLRQFKIEPIKTNDKYLDDFLYSEDTVFYKIDQTYQHYNNTKLIKKFEGPSFGLFHTDFLKDFNANQDFPWETTIGLNTVHKKGLKQFNTVNAIKLPRNPFTGKLAKILVINDEWPIIWLFPEKTIIAEIIYVEYLQYKYVQEVRLRTKEEGSKLWLPNVYRPVKDREEYIKLTGRHYDVNEKFFHFRNTEKEEVSRIEGIVEVLPPLDDESVEKLLNRPFQDVTKHKWSEISHTPTSNQEFHIVPQDYSFGCLKIGSLSCMDCHRQTGISVRNLIPSEKSIRDNPSKVGRIRGSDGIFTWHPFDFDSIRKSTDESFKPIKLRNYDIDKGMLIEFKKEMLNNNERSVFFEGITYKLTKLVQQSLKGDELPGYKEFLNKD